VHVAGNLNIAFVKQDDFHDTREWMCYIHNKVLDVDAGGSESKIVRLTGQLASEFL